jgi:hypothetical protein
MNAKCVQGAEQAAIPGPAECNLGHPRPLVGDVSGGDADIAQHFAHGIRKYLRQPLAFANGNHDRESGSFADEEQVLTATELKDVAVPVAEPRGGLD